MKRLFSNLLSLVLVAIIFCVGYAPSAGAFGIPAPVQTLTGNYNQDTLTVVDSLRTAVDLPDDDASKSEAQAQAKEQINEFISRYRRDNKTAGLASFMTMTTALNALAGHYTAYPSRPLPEKLKTRLDQEFKQVEMALKRESSS
ncbi:MAG: photosystem II protein Psb27 [Thermosynechococcaceae cyanobacterium]